MLKYDELIDIIIIKKYEKIFVNLCFYVETKKLKKFNIFIFFVVMEVLITKTKK
jgi:hypothetical protein